MRAYASDSLVLLRLPTGSDLLEGLTRAAADLGIRAASVTVIGAVSSLAYGYYDQAAHEYHTLRHDGEMEISAAMGNVSLKAGEPFVHLHIVASGTDGSSVGGHLMPGTVVFVAEAAFHVLRGETPVREPDETTGLDLWPTG